MDAQELDELEIELDEPSTFGRQSLNLWEFFKKGNKDRSSKHRSAVCNVCETEIK